MRVTDGIEDFVQSNINNKMDIEEVISRTKEKIDCRWEKKSCVRWIKEI